MEKKWYVIYLHGEEAAKIGHCVQDGFCYHRLWKDGKFLAQLEVTLEDLVDVSFIDSEENVQETLRQLGKLGFAGIEYCVCSYTDEECTKNEEVYQSGKIQNVKPGKSMNVVTLELIVHEEEETWINWWLQTDDEEIRLPYDKENAIPVLRNYDIILVGDRWFKGEDAEAAVAEAFRIAANEQITIVDEKTGNTIAEIRDVCPLLEKFNDGKCRFMSSVCGNIGENLEDVLECPGDTIKFNWKGW